MKALLCTIRSSIAWKQFASLLLALILPLAGATVLFSHRLSNELLSHQTGLLREKAQICSANFEATLREMQDIIASLVVQHDFQTIIKSTAPMPTYSWYEDYKTMTELLSTIASRSNAIYSMHVLSLDGKLYSSDNSYATMPFESPLIQRLHAAAGSYVVMNHQLEQISRKDVITLGRAIRQGHQINGYVWVDVPIGVFDTTFAPFDDHETVTYISCGDVPLLFSSGKLTLDTALTQQLNAAVRAGNSVVYLHQTRYLLMTHNSNMMNCRVTVLWDDEAAFAKTRHLLRDNMLSMALILVLCIIVCVCHSRRIALGIRRLQKAVSQFAQAPEKQVIALRPATQDEVGQLTQDFQTMADCIARLMRRHEEDEHQRHLLEFQALQAQINPHMIYNSLHTISYLAQLQNATNVDEVSQALARLLRKVFHFQGKLITIAEEVDCLRDYAAIKSYGLPWAISTRFNIAPEMEQHPILKLLLQPLLENAFIHAFSARYPVGRISVSIRKEDRHVCLRITDDGQGMSRRRLRSVLRGENAKEGFSGVGLQNVLKRFKLEYGDSCDYWILSCPGKGTVIALRYPVTERKAE